jgi:hypothetical protein
MGGGRGWTPPPLTVQRASLGLDWSGNEMVRSGDGSEVEPPSPDAAPPRRLSSSTARLPSAWPRAQKRRCDRGPPCARARAQSLLSVRGDLFHKLGRYEEERTAFEAAAALAANRREHDLLRRRAAEAEDAAMSS